MLRGLPFSGRCPPCAIDATLRTMPCKASTLARRRTPSMEECDAIDYRCGMELHTSAPRLPQPQSLIGTWRRFGITGPVYEIVAVGEECSGGDRMMRVRVVETGEEVDYRLADILNDPGER